MQSGFTGSFLVCDERHSNSKLTVLGYFKQALPGKIIMSMSIRLIAFLGLTAATTALMALPYLTIN